MSDGLDPYDLEPDEEGEEEEEEEEEEFEEETEVVEIIPQMTSIPGVGPKTAEKLAAAGFDTVQKIADASADKLSEQVSGLSLTKAEGIIAEAVSLLEQVTSGAALSGVSKKSKRKKTAAIAPLLIITFSVSSNIHSKLYNIIPAVVTNELNISIAIII